MKEDVSSVIAKAMAISPPPARPPAVEKKQFGRVSDVESAASLDRLRRSRYIPLINSVLAARQDEFSLPPQGVGTASQPDKSTDVALTVKVERLTTIFRSSESTEEVVDYVFTLKDFFGNVAGVYRLEIKKVEIRRHLAQELAARYPQLLPGNDADEIVRIAALAYGDALKTAPHGYRFLFAGWFRHPGTNRYVFLNNRIPGVESKIRLDSNIDAACQFPAAYLDMAAPAAVGKMVLTLLFAAWAPLAFLYEAAGIAVFGLRCALFLNAPTGTGKTTLAKIFADAITVTPGENVLRFEDTAASLQEGILARLDTVCVVDDLYPQGTAREEAAFRAKLMEITRIAGDGKVKGKMGPDRKPLPDRRYRGTLICTGEYYELTTQSSYFRCWHAHLPAGSIDYESLGLKKLSQHPEIARTFMSGWIEFLEENQTEVLKQLPDISQSTLAYMRQLFPACNHERVLNNVSALMVVARLLSKYIATLTDDARFSEKALITLVQQEAAEQLAFLAQIAPEQVFEDAIRDAIDNGFLILSGDEADFIVNAASVGFIRDDRVYVINSRAEEVIMAYCRKKNLGLRITVDLKEALVRRGTLVEGSGGGFTIKYSKNRKVVPKRPRLIMLPARMFHEERS